MCLDSCGGDRCFEKCCCFKCKCQLSPCCVGVCACCKCFTWCKYCCPCLCWPPRQCMAWFLGIFGFVIMLLCVCSETWVVFGGNGTGNAIRHVETDLRVTQTSWGFWSGAVFAGDEWYSSPKVKDDDNNNNNTPVAEKEINIPDWMGTLGLIICVGLLVLAIGLVILFFGLCASCLPCVDNKGQIRLCRCGMFLFLIADLLFFFSLLYFPYGLGVTMAENLIAQVIRKRQAFESANFEHLWLGLGCRHSYLHWGTAAAVGQSALPE